MRTVCIVLVVLVWSGLAQGQAKPKPKDKPEVTAKVSELEKDYSDNPIAADKKYKGKTIELTGTIKEIGRVKMSSSSFISFEVEGKATVLAHFLKDNEALILKVKKGDRITVVGHCAGKTNDGDLWISRCSDLKKEEAEKK